MSHTNFDVVNYTNSLEYSPVRNRLLISLGVFDIKTVDQAKISLDYLVSKNQAAIDPVARYGSDWMNTQRSTSTLQQYELPYFALKDAIRVSDWQGKRIAGGTRAMTQADLVADYLETQMLSFEDQLERIFADAIFRNVQATKHTEQPDLNISTELGIAQQQHNIDISNPTVLVDVALDDIIGKINLALGDRISYLRKYVCICGASYFKALKSSSVVRSQFAFVNPTSADNIITNYKETLPAMQSFEYNNVLFICSTDSKHNIATNEAFYLPLMFSGSGVFNHYAGVASRHSEVAQTGGARYHQYTTVDPQYRNVEVHGEMSVLALNMLPNVVIKSVNAA